MRIDIARLGPDAQRQILQKVLVIKPQDSKYHNQKAVRLMPNGKLRRFDSQKEARRYDQLAARLRAGEIRDLRLQQTFTLQEAYVSSSGDAVRAITYKADFTYTTLEEVRRCDPQEVICSDGFEDLTGSKQPWTNEIGRMGSEIILADGRFCVERKVVEDVKGARTETYKIKKKLMEERGYHVREV